MDNLSIKINQFYIQNGFFMTKAAMIFNNEQLKSSIFKLEM